jgi:D-3-phosphoglycerate dehydrogenase
MPPAEPREIRVLFVGPREMTEHVRAGLPASFRVSQATLEEEVDQALPQCSAVLDAYMRVRFSADRLSKAPGLRVYVAATTGADHVDEGELTRRGIPLLSLRGQKELLRNITPAAEHSWLLLMACARGLRAAVDDVSQGIWDRNRHPGTMLRGRVLGVIGCGRIGQWMARYARAFGMSCLGHDPHLEEWPQDMQESTLEALLEQSDFVTVHVPLNDETRGLIGRRELARVKPSCILINTSRGEIIDEGALLDALAQGRLAGAGLDVLRGEPDIGRHPLVEYARTHPNLVLTPHIGGFSPDALRYVLGFCCKRLSEFFGVA